MQYITGIHALNLICSLDTTGDWHTSAIQWKNPTMAESDGSLFGEYGIERDKKIPEHSETFFVANHIRALLDLLEQGQYAIAEGMRKDFICNESYNCEIFDKVYSMKQLKNWEEIDAFMEREYMMKWVRYKEERGEKKPLRIKKKATIFNKHDISEQDINDLFSVKLCFIFFAAG